MRAHLTACLLFLVTAGPALCEPPQRRAWEWSDDERIAALSDPDAITARLEHRAKSNQRSADGATPYDIIDGARDPHLFFPFELFEHLVRSGFAGDLRFREAYRSLKEPQRRELGLPPDFWEQLEIISAPLRASNRRERDYALRSKVPVRDDPSRTVLANEICRDSFAALNEARERFGQAFDRFLYEAVARSMSSTILRKRDLARLKATNEGCN